MSGHYVHRYEALRSLVSRLRLDVSHAVRVNQVDQPSTFCNSLPFNRLFAVQAAGQGGGGEVRWRERGQWRSCDLQSGSVLFIPEGQEIEMIFAAGLVMIAVHFRIELIPGQDVLEHESQCRIIPGAGRAEIEELARVLAESQSTIAGLVEAHAVLLRMLSPMLQRPIENLKRHVELDQAYRPLLREVRQHPSAQWSIPQLAGLMAIPASTLSKRFRRDFGLPLKQYLTARLLEAATRRLVISGEPIRRIAADLEFNNEQYFSRFIKTHTGRPPRSYRQHFGQESRGGR